MLELAAPGSASHVAPPSQTILAAVLDDQTSVDNCLPRARGTLLQWMSWFPSDVVNDKNGILTCKRPEVQNVRMGAIERMAAVNKDYVKKPSNASMLPTKMHKCSL